MMLLNAFKVHITQWEEEMVFALQMARKTLCNTDEHIEMAVASQKRYVKMEFSICNLS